MCKSAAFLILVFSLRYFLLTFSKAGSSEVITAGQDRSKSRQS